MTAVAEFDREQARATGSNGPAATPTSSAASTATPTPSLTPGSGITADEAVTGIRDLLTPATDTATAAPRRRAADPIRLRPQRGGGPDRPAPAVQHHIGPADLPRVLLRVLRPARRQVRVPHLPVPRRTGASGHPPATPASRPAPRRTRPGRANPVAAPQTTPRRVPLPPPPSPNPNAPPLPRSQLAALSRCNPRCSSALAGPAVDCRRRSSRYITIPRSDSANCLAPATTRGT